MIAIRRSGVLGLTFLTAVLVTLGFGASSALAVTLDTPADGAITNATPTFSGVAVVGAGYGTDVEVAIYEGPVVTGIPSRLEVADVGAGGAFSVGTAALAQGTYTAEAVQNGPVSIERSAANTFSIDTTAPTISQSNPLNGTETKNRRPTFSGFAGNAANDSPSVTINVYAGGTATGAPVLTMTPTRTGTAYSTQPPSDMADGTYTSRVTQTDSVGNEGLSSPATFRIDNVGPTFTLTSPASFTEVYRDSTPTFTGTGGTAPGDQDVKVRLYATDPSPIQTLEAEVTVAGTWSVDAAALSDGVYSMAVSQQDSLGNFGTTIQSGFRIDTTPVVPPDPPAADPCVVPSVKKGAKLGATKKAITAAGCVVGEVKRKASKKVAKGKVIKLKPKGGTEVPAGTPVTITVSSGAKKK